MKLRKRRKENYSPVGLNVSLRKQVYLGWDPRMCITNKSPTVTIATSPGNIL